MLVWPLATLLRSNISFLHKVEMTVKRQVVRKPCFGLAESIRSSVSQEHQSPVSESRRDQKRLADSMHTDELFLIIYWSTVFYTVPNRMVSSSAISSTKMQVYNFMASSGLHTADPLALSLGNFSKKTQQNPHCLKKSSLSKDLGSKQSFKQRTYN